MLYEVITPYSPKDFLYNKKLLIDHKNNFWLAMHGAGFATFNYQSKEFYYYPHAEDGKGINGLNVMDIIQWGNNHLLIAVDQGGINMLNTTTNTFNYIKSNNPRFGQLSSDGIYSFFFDKDSILWVGTARGGVCYHNPKKNSFSSFSQNSPNTKPVLQQYDFPSRITSYNVCYTKLLRKISSGKMDLLAMLSPKK